jgi:uncharacterized repeat protein (TIGR03803 family)
MSMRMPSCRTGLFFILLLSSRPAANAATFTSLYSFTELSPSGTNTDGGSPVSALVASGNRLYGTAADGGIHGRGIVFAINTDGTGFSDLYDFNSTDGSGPSAALVLDGNTLYGTTRAGGTNGLGTVFAMGTDGKGFVSLHTFGGSLQRDSTTGLNLNSGGAFPETDLVISGNTLYGATEQGGSGGNGTLFKINTDGSGFALLHNFTNHDGGYPSVHMVVSGTNLFGTTQFGGGTGFLGNGTIFRVNTDGSGFTNLYNFDDFAVNPHAGLVMSGETLYGTTTLGSPGNAPYGTVFKINTDGTGFTNFYALDYQLDAGSPTTGLATAGDKIYGTELGFAAFGGTVFQITTDGSGYTNLTSFNERGDPGTLSGVTFADGHLYCTASSGGAFNDGTVFALTLSPSSPPVVLNQAQVGNALILSWTGIGLSLYSAPQVLGPYTNVPNATSPYTNTLFGPQKFFRLKAN